MERAVAAVVAKRGVEKGWAKAELKLLPEKGHPPVSKIAVC